MGARRVSVHELSTQFGSSFVDFREGATQASSDVSIGFYPHDAGEAGERVDDAVAHSTGETDEWRAAGTVARGTGGWPQLSQSDRR